MDATSNGWPVGCRHNVTNSEPTTHKGTLHSLPTPGMKAGINDIDKQQPAPLAQRTANYVLPADKLLGQCLSNTDAAKALPATSLVMSYDRWLDYLQSTKEPMSPSSLAMIESARDRVTPFEQLVFMVELSGGFGDLNLYIECIRCFKRLSTNTIKRIVFTGDIKTLTEKLPPLISGFSQASHALAQGSFSKGTVSKSTVSKSTTPCHRAPIKSPYSDPRSATSGKLFGIDYVVSDKMPNASDRVLYVYTINDSEAKLPANCQSVQIVNYRWFNSSNKREGGVVLNKENHLPVYPCEVMSGIMSTGELHAELGRSFAELGANCENRLYASPAAVTSLLVDMFTRAAAGKIHLAFCYHSVGMNYWQYSLYIQAALKCCADKPIFLIAPIIYDVPNFLTVRGRKKLINEMSVDFFDIRILTDKSTIDMTNNNRVTVINTGTLPKRVVEMVGLFSTLPGFGPGASTANLFECLGIPYLGQDGHDITTAGDATTVERWQFINRVFDFKPYALHEFVDSCKKTDGHVKRLILENWFNPRPGTKTDPEDLGPVAATFLHHFFQGTENIVPQLITLSPAQSKDYIDRLLANESLIQQYIDYIQSKSTTIIADYLLSATAADGEFRQHAAMLQERALNPENNTLIEAIKRQLTSNSTLTIAQSLNQIISQAISALCNALLTARTPPSDDHA